VEIFDALALHTYYFAAYSFAGSQKSFNSLDSALRTKKLHG
jgi:hypothetical protein